MQTYGESTTQRRNDSRYFTNNQAWLLITPLMTELDEKKDVEYFSYFENNLM